MRDNSDKKKNTGHLYFNEESIYEFKTLAYMALKFCYAQERVTNERTNERKDKPEAIPPPPPPPTHPHT